MVTFSFTLILFPNFKAIKEPRPRFGLEADRLLKEDLNASDTWMKKATAM
jgi:hypothetical protein